MDKKLIRSYGKTKYLFDNVQLLQYNENTTPIFAISGRFIKDTILESEQVRTANGLIPSHDSIRSSPSSIFVLILNNHKLLFLPETKFAPNLSEFKGTIQNFITRKREQFIDNIYKQKKEEFDNGTITKKVLKKNLYVEFPAADLKIQPLANEGSIKDFISKFSVLNEVEVTVVDTNHEIDPLGFGKAFREQKAKLASTKSSFKHKSSSGLTTRNCAEFLEPIGESGNFDVDLNGFDNQGDPLSGNLSDLKLKIPMDEPQINEEVGLVTKRIIDKVITLNNNNDIKVLSGIENCIDILAEKFAHYE